MIELLTESTQTTLYIVMEYGEGRNLASVITKRAKERQYLDEEFVLQVMIQLTLALKECHRQSHVAWWSYQATLGSETSQCFPRWQAKHQTWRLWAS